MRKMMICSMLLVMILLGGCKLNKEVTTVTVTTETPKEELQVVSQIKYTDNGKAYFTVLGKPFLIIGGQVRLDGLQNRGEGAYQPPEMAPKAATWDEIERYFSEAKHFGLNTLQIPIDWRDIEPEKDIYDFSVLDKLLTLANTYDLKVELLWFSTNMCGDSHSFHIPDYIWNDKETYPRMQYLSNKQYIDEHWTWMYGFTGFLVLDDDDLLEREAKVLTNMMNYIYEWNKANGNKFPVISIQVHNEPDGLLRWRVDQGQIKFNEELVSKERIWEMTLNALNNAGLAIKQSKYQVVTRVNLTVTTSINPFPQALFASPLDVLALEGIDIIGDDPYIESPKIIKNTILSYSIHGNYPHIAENMGNYAATPSLLLAAYATGGSYNIYDFATPPYFVWFNEYLNSTYQMDQGILRPDFSNKPHSELTRRIIKGINEAFYIIALSDKENFAAFNIHKPLPEHNLTQTINTSNVQFTFKTDNGAIGFGITDDEYIYVYATDHVQIKMDNVVLYPVAYIGKFAGDGQFISLETVYPTDAYISIEGGKLYRFRMREKGERLNSTTMDNI